MVHGLVNAHRVSATGQVIGAGAPKEDVYEIFCEATSGTLVLVNDGGDVLFQAVSVASAATGSTYPIPREGRFSAGGGCIEGADELAKNRFFDSDTQWTKGSQWAISGGIASIDGSQASTSDLSQAGLLADGADYVIEFEIKRRDAGNISVRAGTEESESFNAVGVHKAYLRANGTGLALRASASFDGDIDNVSVKKVDGGSRLVVNSISNDWQVRTIRS